MNPSRVQLFNSVILEQTWNLPATQSPVICSSKAPLSPSSSLSAPCDNNNSSTARSCTFQLIFLLSFLLLSLIIVPALAPLPKKPSLSLFFFSVARFTSQLIRGAKLSWILSFRGVSAGWVLYFELRLLSFSSCR